MKHVNQMKKIFTGFPRMISARIPPKNPAGIPLEPISVHVFLYKFLQRFFHILLKEFVLGIVKKFLIKFLK